MSPQQRPLPLASQQTFASSNFQEVEAIFTSLCFPVRLEALDGKQPFDWCSNYAKVGDIAIGAHDMSAGVRGSSDNVADIIVLHLPIGTAPGETWRAGERYELVPGTAGYIIEPGIPGHVMLTPGYRNINVDLKQTDVDRALTTLTGEAPRARVRFRPLVSMTAPGPSALIRLLQYIVSEVDAATLAPPVLDRLGEAFTFQLLHSQPHNHSALFAVAPEPAEPLQVRRVAEYLDQHVERPIRMSDLTRLTGTTARSIQAGFRKHRGCSPMDFLRARRLERARTMLGYGDGKHVTEIARACGFQHPGRFSTYYRARFGETPAQTSSRRRRR